MELNPSFCVNVSSGDEILFGPGWVTVEREKTLIDVLVQVSGTKALGQQVQVIISKDSNFTEAALVQLSMPVSLLQNTGNPHVKFLLKANVLPRTAINSYRDETLSRYPAERDTDGLVLKPEHSAYLDHKNLETHCIDNVNSSRMNIAFTMESDYLRSLFKDKKLSPSTIVCIQEELVRRNSQKTSGQYTTWQKQGVLDDEISGSNERCKLQARHAGSLYSSDSVGQIKWESSPETAKCDIVEINGKNEISEDCTVSKLKLPGDNIRNKDEGDARGNSVETKTNETEIGKDSLQNRKSETKLTKNSKIEGQSTLKGDVQRKVTSLNRKLENVTKTETAALTKLKSSKNAISSSTTQTGKVKTVSNTRLSRPVSKQITRTANACLKSMHADPGVSRTTKTTSNSSSVRSPSLHLQTARLSPTHNPKLETNIKCATLPRKRVSCGVDPAKPRPKSFVGTSRSISLEDKVVNSNKSEIKGRDRKTNMSTKDLQNSKRKLEIDEKYNKASASTILTPLAACNNTKQIGIHKEEVNLKDSGSVEEDNMIKQCEKNNTENPMSTNLSNSISQNTLKLTNTSEHCESNYGISSNFQSSESKGTFLIETKCETVQMKDPEARVMKSIQDNGKQENINNCAQDLNVLEITDDNHSKETSENSNPMYALIESNLKLEDVLFNVKTMFNCLESPAGETMENELLKASDTNQRLDNSGNEDGSQNIATDESHVGAIILSTEAVSLPVSSKCDHALGGNKEAADSHPVLYTYTNETSEKINGKSEKINGNLYKMNGNAGEENENSAKISGKPNKLNRNSDNMNEKPDKTNSKPDKITENPDKITRNLSKANKTIEHPPSSKVSSICDNTIDFHGQVNHLNAVTIQTNSENPAHPSFSFVIDDAKHPTDYQAQEDRNATYSSKDVNTSCSDFKTKMDVFQAQLHKKSFRHGFFHSLLEKTVESNNALKTKDIEDCFWIDLQGNSHIQLDSRKMISTTVNYSSNGSSQAETCDLPTKAFELPGKISPCILPSKALNNTQNLNILDDKQKIHLSSNENKNENQSKDAAPVFFLANTERQGSLNKTFILDEEVEQPSRTDKKSITTELGDNETSREIEARNKDAGHRLNQSKISNDSNQVQTLTESKATFHDQCDANMSLGQSPDVIAQNDNCFIVPTIPDEIREDNSGCQFHQERKHWTIHCGMMDHFLLESLSAFSTELRTTADDVSKKTRVLYEKWQETESTQSQEDLSSLQKEEKISPSKTLNFENQNDSATIFRNLRKVEVKLRTIEKAVSSMTSTAQQKNTIDEEETKVEDKIQKMKRRPSFSWKQLKSQAKKTSWADKGRLKIVTKVSNAPSESNNTKGDTKC